MKGFLDVVAEQGFAFVPGFRPGISGFDVARSIGEIWGGSREQVHQLVPATIQRSTPNTYSGRYGVGPFPMHTDLAHYRMPPRYFMLRSIKGCADVATYLADGLDLIRNVGAPLLTRALVQPRRFRGGNRPLLNLFQPHDGGNGLLRWDDVYNQPASPDNSPRVTI